MWSGWPVCMCQVVIPFLKNHAMLQSSTAHTGLTCNEMVLGFAIMNLAHILGLHFVVFILLKLSKLKQLFVLSTGMTDNSLHWILSRCE